MTRFPDYPKLLKSGPILVNPDSGVVQRIIVLHSPGQPLDSSTRAFMEPLFGHDLINMVFHTNPRTAKLTQAKGSGIGNKR